MSLKIWVKLMAFATFVALIYIHMQMQIFDLAYKGKAKERAIHDLRDVNGVLTHQVLTLKSSNHLGNQLLDKNSNLQFMSNDHVMTMPSKGYVPRQIVLEDGKPKNEHMFWGFLSVFTPREAKAWERE